MKQRPSAARTVGKPSEADRVYEFLPRDPDKGYLDTSLWLPKKYINPQVYKAGLEFDVGETGRLVLWQEAPHHLIVPRYLDVVDAPFEIIDRTPQFTQVAFDDRITLRPGQDKAWAAVAAANHGILNLATGLGKTVLAIKKIAQRGYPALVIVPQGAVMEQWIEAVEKFLGITPGRVQGPVFDWQKPVVLAMIHTLTQRLADWPIEFRKYYGTVIYDEVHHLGASTFSQTADLFWGARYGLTATPNREDATEAVYYYHLGSIFYSDLVQDLQPTIYFQQIDTPVDLSSKKVRDSLGELSIPKLRAELGANQERNEIIASHIRLAETSGRKLLVLGHSIPGLQNLKELVPTAELIIGKVPQKKRLSVFQTAQTVFATAEIASEALDAPSLDTVFFITPFKSWRMMVQGMGRALRQHAGKGKAMVVIFEDRNLGPCKAMCRHLKRELTSSGYDVATIQPTAGGAITMPKQMQRPA